MGYYDENYDWHDKYEPYDDFEKNTGCGCLIIIGAAVIAAVFGIAALILFLI